jgi:hypothetical protein
VPQPDGGIEPDLGTNRGGLSQTKANTQLPFDRLLHRAKQATQWRWRAFGALPELLDDSDACTDRTSASPRGRPADVVEEFFLQAHRLCLRGERVRAE